MQQANMRCMTVMLKNVDCFKL